MKLKINKACDLSSISVFPPNSRRMNAITVGTDSSVFGKNQASQLRLQQSQQSFSHGISSQSQFSQNSLVDAVTNEQRFGSQERENSEKRVSCFAPTTYPREETQMLVPKSSNNHLNKWNPDHKCKISEELEHRMRLMETSINRLGMILDSVQSDVMQVNKAIKAVSFETEGIRKTLTVCDNSLQLMSKGDGDLKASIDGSVKSILGQLRRDTGQYELQETVSVLSSLPDLIEARLLKLQNELCGAFSKEMKVVANNMKPPNCKHPEPTILLPKVEPTILPPKRRGFRSIQSQRDKLPVKENRVVPPKVRTQATILPKMETGSWKSLEPKLTTFTDGVHHMEPKKEFPLTEQGSDWRIIIESDEETDTGFSCLLNEKQSGEDRESYLIEEAKEETERILRKARRRKRKCFNTIILN